MLDLAFHVCVELDALLAEKFRSRHKLNEPQKAQMHFVDSFVPFCG
jgi:hypothetical protein